MAISALILSLISFFIVFVQSMFSNWISNNLSNKIVFLICIILVTCIFFIKKRRLTEWNILLLAIVSSLSFSFFSYIGVLSITYIWLWSLELFPNIALIIFTSNWLLSYGVKFFSVVFYSTIPVTILIFCILKFYKQIYKKDTISTEEVKANQKRELKEEDIITL